MKTLMGALMLVAAVGCTGDRDESAPTNGQEPRHPLGKADSIGSCVEHCGGKSDGNCWCDDQCESYGDCCDDYTPVCQGGAPLPEGLQVQYGYAPMGSIESAVAFDGTNYLVVWQDNRGTGGHIISIDGARVSAAGEVLDVAGFTILRSLANQSLPAVTFDGENFIVVAMHSSGSVRVNRVSPAGQLLDGEDGRSVASISGYVEEISSATGAGVTLIAWTSHIPGSGTATVRLIDAEADPVGAITKLWSGFHDNVPKAAFNGSHFLVTWIDGTPFSLGTVRGVRVATDGQVLDATPIEIGQTAADVREVSVAAVDSTWLVAWEDAPGVIAAARVQANGSVLDPASIALTNLTHASSPTVGSDGTGFLVAWRTSSPNSEIRLNRVETNGSVADGSGVLLHTDEASAILAAPSMGCHEDGCLVTWSRGRGADSFGKRVKGTTVLDAEPIHITAAASRQEWPAIARGGNHHLAVWEDMQSGVEQQIVATRLDISGNVLDPSGIDLCEPASGLCGAKADDLIPRVAGTDAGDFFVVWADKRTPLVPNYVDVYGTRVLADGTVVSPNGVELTSSDDSEYPDIASDGNGYLLTWIDRYNGLFASRLSPQGAMLDSPPLKLASNMSTNGMEMPAVAYGGGHYLVVVGTSQGVRGFRIPPVGAPLDASPGLSIGSGSYPSVTFDGTQWVVAYRRYDSSSNFNQPKYHMLATRVATNGTVLDPNGVKLSVSSVRGYTSAYYRLGPQASFDGADSVFTWGSSYDGGQVFAAWLSPEGVAFGSRTLVSRQNSIPLSPTIIGRGDGDHSLLLYAEGDPTPKIRSFRIASQDVIFRINGHACSGAAECKSGYCIDGVCCDTACGGGAHGDCLACGITAGASAPGVCTTLDATACND